MSSMQPADELAMIRADLRRLKEREAFLHRGMLEKRLSLCGKDAVASVKIMKKRHLRADLLPDHVRENDAYWETQVLREIHVERAQARKRPPHKHRNLDYDFVVVEPI